MSRRYREDYNFAYCTCFLTITIVVRKKIKSSAVISEGSKIECLILVKIGNIVHVILAAREDHVHSARRRPRSSHEVAAQFRKIP
jgi:hypothetical protein